LGVTIFFQKNVIPRILTVVVILVVIGLWILHFTGIDPRAMGLRTTVLFVGTINGLYSVIDIFDDTVERDVNGSDANTCAFIMGCPDASKSIGLCWLIISLALFISGIIINLLIVEPPN